MCLYVFTVHASTDMYTEIHKVEIKQVRGQVGRWDDPKHGPRYFEHGPGCVSPDLFAAGCFFPFSTHLDILGCLAFSFFCLQGSVSIMIYPLVI